MRVNVFKHLDYRQIQRNRTIASQSAHLRRQTTSWVPRGKKKKEDAHVNKELVQVKLIAVDLIYMLRPDKLLSGRQYNVNNVKSEFVQWRLSKSCTYCMVQ